MFRDIIEIVFYAVMAGLVYTVIFDFDNVWCSRRYIPSKKSKTNERKSKSKNANDKR